MDELMQSANWSDRFFNGDWVPDNPRDGEKLREAAAEFLRLFPDCPYTANWLVADFLKRL